MPYNIKIRMEITEDMIQDLVTTAFCGGIGYWAVLDNSGEDFENAPNGECIDETVARLLMEGKTIKLIDVEDEEIYLLTLKKLLRGFKEYVVGGYDYDVVDGKVDMCSIDADRADKIVQLGLFGEEVFG